MHLAEQQLLDANRIILGSLVGAGTFAAVHLCEVKDSERQGGGFSACVKRLQRSSSDELTNLLVQECQIWSHLQHANIVRFHGIATVQDEELWMVIEYMPDGSLEQRHDALRECQAPPPAHWFLLDQMQQVACGMQYLHAIKPMPVLHRDLKSANVLVSAERQRLAISDFGLARHQADLGTKMTAETGSYRWMAPEVIRHEEYDTRCDVFSYAMLALEMVTYDLPWQGQYKDMEVIFAVASRNERPTIPPDACPPSLADLIHRCWVREPTERPTFDDICAKLEEVQVVLSKTTSSHSGRPTGISEMSNCTPGREPAECNWIPLW